MRDGAQKIGWKEREYLAYREAILSATEEEESSDP